MDEHFKQDPLVRELFKKHFDVFDYYGQVGLAKNYQLELKLKPNVSHPKVRQPIYNEE